METALVTITSPYTFDAAGQGISGGDVDGDGVNDLLVGSPNEDGQRGAGYLFHGGSDLLQATSFTDAAASFHGGEHDAGLPGMAGSTTHDALGSEVACAGDFDGDGRADLLLTAPTDGMGDAYGGLVLLVYGGPLH